MAYQAARGGLSTRGACSKVSHLHRQCMQTRASSAKLRSPPVHFSQIRSTSGQGPRSPSGWCQILGCSLQTKPYRGSPQRVRTLMQHGLCPSSLLKRALCNDAGWCRSRLFIEPICSEKAIREDLLSFVRCNSFLGPSRLHQDPQPTSHVVDCDTGTSKNY